MQRKEQAIKATVKEVPNHDEKVLRRKRDKTRRKLTSSS
jgi:hypothetical protein